jgi:DNA-binding IclR family transcriptional regulator
MATSSDRGSSNPSFRTVDRALMVLNLLGTRPSGVSLAELARMSGIPMTTLHRLLAVLREASLVRETDAGLHAIGVGAVVLGRAFLDGVDLREVAKGQMKGLVETTGETCHLGVLASVHIVYLEKVDSPHPVRMHSSIGGVSPAVSTALGRAILAHSTRAAVLEVLEGSERLLGLQLESPDVFELLDEVRQRGYSTDLQENELGICCVGAPVFDHTGRVIAGLSLSTPASRFQTQRLDSIGQLVANASREISGSLGWAGDRPESDRTA